MTTLRGVAPLRAGAEAPVSPLLVACGDGAQPAWTSSTMNAAITIREYRVDLVPETLIARRAYIDSGPMFTSDGVGRPSSSCLTYDLQVHSSARGMPACGLSERLENAAISSAEMGATVLPARASCHEMRASDSILMARMVACSTVAPVTVNPCPRIKHTFLDPRVATKSRPSSGRLIRMERGYMGMPSSTVARA